MQRSSSTAALGAARVPKVMPTRAEDYDMQDEIGQGVSAKVVWLTRPGDWQVYRALCKTTNETVAIKVLDLERQDPGKLEEIRKEAQTMSLLNHPNLVSCYCSFVTGPNLYVVMPYFSGGSVLNIMKWGHPQGLEEPVIATIIDAVLKALSYFHRNGNIHRDIKAGNILIDDHGNVKLADYGVATSGFGSFDMNAHQTFVGTPCWMAPEVMEQSNGYDQQADIWSLGITLLELAHGHAPFAKYPPMKVLMMTLQNPPPTLEADSGTRHFGRHLRDLVALCLQKDPKKRPTAHALQAHRFLQSAKKPDFLVKTLLEGIPPLSERVKLLREREIARRGGAVETDAKSQSEYVRGVSNWNFNIEDLKAEASGGGEPKRESPRSSVTSSASADGVKVQHKGRFEVYDSDAAASSDAAVAGSEAAATSESTKVRKGRFVVEEVVGDAAPPSASASADSEQAEHKLQGLSLSGGAGAAAS